MAKTKLRLLLSPLCNRTCPGCCNKDWDLDGLPIFDCADLSKYKEYILTGGEPMLIPDIVINVTDDIREANREADIYMYTAKTDDPETLYRVVFGYLDGVTITLHEQSDVDKFIQFMRVIDSHRHGAYSGKKSLRLNVFAGIDYQEIYKEYGLFDWKIKSNMRWIKNCPLPVDEDFKQI